MILICDDREDQEAQWVTALKEADYVNFEIESLHPDEEFGQAISALQKRKRRAREIHENDDEMPEAIEEANVDLSGGEEESIRDVDDASILFIDYDLLNLDEFATGEDVAYLARCYSKCDLIVALNQFNFGKLTFDLTLRGHPHSFADLNISSKLIETDYEGLWKEPWKDEFRPWSLPLLPDAVERFRERVEILDGHIEDQILNLLEVPDQVSNNLPRSVLEFLGEEGEDATFRQFVQESGQGVKENYGPLARESVKRIAAARISHWLEQIVLPGQNILVDAPHLISRYPSLLPEDQIEDPRAWDETADFVPADELNIDSEKIESSLLEEKPVWISQPAWYWRQVSENEEIAEVKEPWAVDHPEYIFCEDTSNFVTSRSEVSEFVADLDSQFVRRYVKRIDRLNSSGKSIVYRPRVRFSFSDKQTVA